MMVNLFGEATSMACAYRFSPVSYRLTRCLYLGLKETKKDSRTTDYHGKTVRERMRSDYSALKQIEGLNHDVTRVEVGKHFAEDGMGTVLICIGFR